MNLWWRSSLLKRDTYFHVPDAKKFPNFKPSYENEKHDMWAVMRMDYQKRWEAERDVVRDDFEFYRKEKVKYLQRRYVTRLKMADVRREQLLNKKTANLSTRSKFSSVPARVDTNLRALKRSKSDASKITRGRGDRKRDLETTVIREAVDNKKSAQGDEEVRQEQTSKTLQECCEVNNGNSKQETPDDDTNKNDKENVESSEKN